MDLKTTLRQLLDSGTDENPALNSLLSDYARYHAVLVVLGSAFVLALLVLSAVSWRRFFRAPRIDGRRWTFERRTYLFFGASSLALGGTMALVVLVNMLNALDPRHGFAGTIDMIGTPPPGSRRAEVHEAFTTWLQSESEGRPGLVQSQIDDRLAWQRPKAIICGVLLVLSVALGARLWRTLIRRSRVQAGTNKPFLALALACGPTSVLLMIMTIANTQATLAPETMTLLFG